MSINREFGTWDRWLAEFGQLTGFAHPMIDVKLFVDPGTYSRVHSILGGLKGPEKHLRSGELARATGVSTDTLRHYERLGVLPRPRRTANNYRQYAPEAVQRVQLIQRALSVGFSLAELVRVLRVRDAGGAPCQHVRALAADKLNHIDRRLRELGVMRKLLKQLIADWDKRLKRTPDGQRAGLLELLPGSLAKSSRKGIRA